MANHKSAIKFHKRSEKNNLRNASIKSRVKTFFKKAILCIENGNKQNAIKASSLAESIVMKGVAKGTYKLNKASRMISSLSRKIKKMDVNTA